MDTSVCEMDQKEGPTLGFKVLKVRGTFSVFFIYLNNGFKNLPDIVLNLC